MSERNVGAPAATGGVDGEPELRAEHAYLLQNRMNPFPVAGELELTRTRIRFVLKPSSVDALTGWLEDAIAEPDLKQRLRAGERIVAFDLDRATLEHSWPKQFMGAGMKLGAPGEREWLVSLVYPSGQYYTVYKALTGRSQFKQWKQALAGGSAR